MNEFRIISVEDLIHELKEYNHKALHVHHTWKPEHKDFNGKNHLILQQGMRNYHVNVKNWRDIAQHVTLMPDGKFVTGRDFAKIPVSISGYNTGAFAMEMLGNFDVGNDFFRGPQKESALTLIEYFMNQNRKIIFHNEHSYKTCPGTSIKKEEIISMIQGKYKEWQLEAGETSINELFDNGMINNPKMHIEHLKKSSIDPWLFWVIVNRIVKLIIKKGE